MAALGHYQPFAQQCSLSHTVLTHRAPADIVNYRHFAFILHPNRWLCHLPQNTCFTLPLKASAPKTNRGAFGLRSSEKMFMQRDLNTKTTPFTVQAATEYIGPADPEDIEERRRRQENSSLPPQLRELTQEVPEPFNPLPWLAVKRPWETADARLVLEDGSIWKAKSFGAKGTQVGEVVFNTSLTGYQEILTDPSYAGQFVLMTNPHIGNTGVNIDDEESNQCFLGGLVIRNLSTCVSNWRSAETLPEYLRKRNVMGIHDVDTRAITRRLREDGSLIGVISTESSKSDDELLNMARSWDIVGMDLISGVTCSEPYEWKDATSAEWDFNSHGKASDKLHVVAYDFGIKHNILRRIASYGCKITVVPSTWPSSEVLKLNPDGVLFSNGPGDPSAVPYAVENVKQVVGKIPVFGICMGHQLLGQALGGKTFKMKFGHHGGNHPVRNLRSGRVEISAQNHNYAVDPATLPEGVEVTHINLNDGTCAGLAFPAMKVMSLQYHPEASPGPHDSDPAFYEFVKLMRENKHIDK